MVHLITGYKGTEHIQSQDARSFNTAMFGSGEFVMDIGKHLEASIINNSTVRILDGDILMQGGHIRIETDTYEDLTIITGTAGTNRYDLIVMTYEKNPNDGTEMAYLEVLKGTETPGIPVEPSCISGNLASGAMKNQMPLYRVTIEGVVLTNIEQLFSTIPTYKTLAEQYAIQFQRACDTYLGALNVLDTMEEVEANTQPLQLVGALAVKEGFEAVKSKLESYTRSEITYKNIESSRANSYFFDIVYSEVLCSVNIAGISLTSSVSENGFLQIASAFTGYSTGMNYITIPVAILNSSLVPKGIATLLIYNGTIMLCSPSCEILTTDIIYGSKTIWYLV